MPYNNCSIFYFSRVTLAYPGHTHGAPLIKPVTILFVASSNPAKSIRVCGAFFS